MGIELPEVISVEEEWDALTDLPARATRCPFYLVLVNERNARTTVVHKLCGSWWDRECAEGRARLALRQIAARASDHPVLFVALEDYDPALLTRVRQRRKQHGAEGFSIRRGDRLHRYSTHYMPGRKPPTSWMELPVEAVVELLAYQSLRLPGVGERHTHGPIDWSDGWRPRSPEAEEEEDRPRWRRAGSGGSFEDLDLALKRTARRARLRFGVHFPVLIPYNIWSWGPPPGVPPEWWHETLAEELRRGRA